jgi:hypothetical protein
MWPVSARSSPAWRCRSLCSFPRRTNRSKRKRSHKAQVQCWCGRVRRTSHRRSRHTHSKRPAVLKNLPKNSPKNLRLRLARRSLHSRRQPPEISAANLLRLRRKRGGSSMRSALAVGPTSRTLTSRAAFSVTPTDRAFRLKAFKRKNDPDTTPHHRQAHPDCVHHAGPFR